jgi:Fe2+ or Zn2+ uptake regulation protein
MTDERHAVLELLLDHHPGLLSTDEVIRKMTAGADSFAERDAVEIALRELVEAGLAHRLGSFVFASYAAASFQQVQDGR